MSSLFTFKNIVVCSSEALREAYERAKELFEEHERKFRREKKLVAKYKEKVRYYEKALAEKKAASPVSKEKEDAHRA